MKVVSSGGDLGRTWFLMEIVVNCFASRNDQKVKNEVVTLLTKGMTKVIYNLLGQIPK